MTKNNDSEEELKDFRSSLEKVEQKDFDGHTNFQDLSVREKLIWLSELNYFKYIVKKLS
mgnify:CR=1 FL=1